MQYAHAASPSEIAPKIIEGQTASLAYKWVLTAAHCVTSTDYTKGTYKVYNTNYIKIGYGTYENTENNTVSVKNIIVHPDFDHITYVRDIALIELDTDLEQTNNTRPVLISNSTLSSGQNLTVVGWGQTSNNDYTPAKTLMEAQMTTLPDDDCKAALSTYEGQNGSNICMSHAAQPG
ncbi:Ovochymase-1 [Spiromyces aspiralis]|uniref:Ovochymase-1 n=1 Tax=Spiromyces aspiralis TaxID=68401 RepID=A0ACC1HFG4_9FUNG|nr:Ovochymase-1 [Spiromyces aspiralis]